MTRIAVFVSGSGSNMQKIAEYFAQHPELGQEIALVVSDQPEAYVLQRAEALGIKAIHLTPRQLNDVDTLLPILAKESVDAVVLAGYLRLVPRFMLEAYKDRIVNIHPALLPKYGGKGMYGMNVHRAVKEAGEAESGITIHLIDEVYDRGTPLFQATTAISPEDTPEDIAHKVQQLEHQHFPRVVSEWLSTLFSKTL